MKLDNTDKKLINLLQEDSKRTNKQLSLLLNLSVTAVFERIKKLLPDTLQSKVAPFKETHEKILYKKTQLNEALLHEQSIPLRAQLLSKIGFFSQLEACVIPDVSQMLGATNNITRELDSRLNAIPLKQDIESYKLEVDREINLFREQTLCKRRAESLDTSSTTPNKRPRVTIQS
mgnify:CR=1 FL=1